MRNFEYRAPGSLAEAVELLGEDGVSARALAGGTDLLVQLRAGRWVVDRIVDVKGVPELNELTLDPENGLRIGGECSLSSDI